LSEAEYFDMEPAEYLQYVEVAAECRDDLAHRIAAALSGQPVRPPVPPEWDGEGGS
jgi:hypothetical protein